MISRNTAVTRSPSSGSSGSSRSAATRTRTFSIAELARLGRVPGPHPSLTASGLSTNQRQHHKREALPRSSAGDHQRGARGAGSCGLSATRQPKSRIFDAGLSGLLPLGIAVARRWRWSDGWPVPVMAG